MSPPPGDQIHIAFLDNQGLFEKVTLISWHYQSTISVAEVGESCLPMEVATSRCSDPYSRSLKIKAFFQKVPIFQHLSDCIRDAELREGYRHLTVMGSIFAFQRKNP